MNDFNALIIASLTPQEIEAGNHSPEEIFSLMISTRKIDNEKVIALFARNDVKGKVAFDMLKKIAELSDYTMTKEFKFVSDLYIQKFIRQKNRRNSLIYTVLTCQLWFHDIGSGEPSKRETARERLEVLAPLLLSFFNRWSGYRRNTDLLIQDLEDIFGRYYNEKFCFPGDNESPFEFSHDNYVYKEVRSYVFPLLGNTLRHLSTLGKACLKPESALPLVTNELIGSNYWTFYIEKVKDVFTLEDLRIFDKQSLEKFFIDKKEAAIYQRLRNMCQEEKAIEVFRLFNFNTEFAGLSLLENQEYSGFPLSEKAEFLRMKANDSYSEQYRNQMLKFWTNDAAWDNKENHLKDLVEVLLDNKSFFYVNRDIYAMKALLLRNAYAGDYLLNARQEILIKGILRDEDNVSEELVEEMSKNINLLVKVLCLINASNSDKFKSAIYKHYWMRPVLDVAFVKMLINLLPLYSEQTATNLILLALPEEIENVSGYEECIDYIINHNHKIEDLEFVLWLFDKKLKDSPVTEKLARAITSKIGLIEKKEARLTKALWMLLRTRYKFPLNCFLEAVTESLKTFSTIDSLIEAFKSIDVLHDSRDEVYHWATKEIEDTAAKLCRNREDFFNFSRSKYFKDDILAWRWFLNYNPVKDFSEIQDDLPKYKEIFNINYFGGYLINLRKNLVELWKSKPFEDTSSEIFFSFMLAQPNEHPEWKKISLAKRIDFIISGALKFRAQPNELLKSLKDGFSEAWVEEKWTASRYLEQIMPVKNEYFADDFASLALDMI